MSDDFNLLTGTKVGLAFWKRRCNSVSVTSTLHDKPTLQRQATALQTGLRRAALSNPERQRHPVVRVIAGWTVTVESGQLSPPETKYGRELRLEVTSLILTTILHTSPSHAFCSPLTSTIAPTSAKRIASDYCSLPKISKSCISSLQIYPRQPFHSK